MSQKCFQVSVSVKADSKLVINKYTIHVTKIHKAATSKAYSTSENMKKILHDTCDFLTELWHLEDGRSRVVFLLRTIDIIYIRGYVILCMKRRC